MAISVIIVTKNESHAIRACLESVVWADEIIVFDSGSSDDTVNICREYTEKVFITDWPGYGQQKNRALKEASGDWVLCLDADEIITPTLAIEIQNTLPTTFYSAFLIPFRSYFLGQPIRFGDWFSERHLRLFRRENGRFSEALLHENLTVSGEIGKLKNRIHHFSYESIEEVLDKLQRYSNSGAAEYFRRGKKSSFSKALLKSYWAFFRSYFLRAGFLDGQMGYALASYISQYTFYRYIRLLEMNCARREKK